MVADPDDPASVAAIVQELARDPERVARMSQRAREVAPEFAMDKELQRFNEIIEQIAYGREPFRSTAEVPPHPSLRATLPRKGRGL